MVNNNKLRTVFKGMSDYRITLKPVYSCPASETPKDVKLPEGWSLSWHQAATLEAIRDPNIDVIFNTAMTGDGKSLAAYLETLLTDFCAIGLYPTNELARDQETQIQDYVEKFQADIKPRIVRLSGQELEIYAENEGLKKAAAIESRASNSEILLSNPDIFHYLHQGKYLTRKDSPDKLWNRIDKDFNLFVFDEFHVFQAPQIASVINTMLLIKNTNRYKKFLFLSATPNKQLIKRLKIAGFRCKEINPIDENKYQFPDTEAQCQQLNAQGWRQVSREISLQFISLEPSNKASETWLKDNSNLILAHFQQYPGSKGAIILNSIAAVKRLTEAILPPEMLLELNRRSDEDYAEAPNVARSRIELVMEQTGPETLTTVKKPSRAKVPPLTKVITLFDVDSTEVGPAHWGKVVDCILDNYDDFDGFIVTHGTNTLAYTASALTFG